MDFYGSNTVLLANSFYEMGAERGRDVRPRSVVSLPATSGTSVQLERLHHVSDLVMVADILDTFSDPRVNRLSGCL